MFFIWANLLFRVVGGRTVRDLEVPAQLVGIGPHAGSWTSPADDVSRWRTRPSPDTAASWPCPPTWASYRIILPLGAKLGESSRVPSVSVCTWPVASSRVAIR